MLHFFDSFDFSLDVSFSFLNSAFFHGFLNSWIWYAMAISFNFCQFWLWVSLIGEFALMLSLVLKSTPGVWCRSIQFFWWCHSLLHHRTSTRLFSAPFFEAPKCRDPPPDIMAPLNTTIQNHSEPFWIFKTINYTKNYPKLSSQSRKIDQKSNKWWDIQFLSAFQQCLTVFNSCIQSLIQLYP